MSRPPEVACPYCQRLYRKGEQFCPACGRLVVARTSPEEVHLVAVSAELAPSPPAHYVITLNSLDPIEAVAWETRGEKVTPPQFLKLLASRGLDIETHPIFGMIIDCCERARHIECEHSSHDTEAKKEKCRRSQAAKLAARTLRHHIGFLDRLDMWSDPRSLMRHAMWSCIERHDQSCPACRSREGIVIPVEDKRVPVLHPGCNCTLVQLARGPLASKTIQRTLRYVEARNPERARVMRENLAKSGFGTELGAGCCGCALPMVLVPLMTAAIWWLSR